MLLTPDLIDEHTRRFIEMLLSEGYSVTCVGKQNPKPEEQTNYSYVKYPDFRLLQSLKFYRLRQFFTDLINTLFLRLIWFKIKPDVVHVIFITKSAYYCALAKIHPLVLTALGSDINKFFYENMRNSQLCKKISHALVSADYVTADTNEILDECEELAGRSLKKSLFYFGIDLDLFRPRSSEEKQKLRKHLGILETSKIILSPRRINPKMRHDQILRAYSIFSRECEFETVLIFRLFGKFDEEYKMKLQELAKDLGIATQVIWADEMDYQILPILYSMADLVINYPNQDGLPVTLFEVSACMAPVVTSDLTAYKEFLSQGAYYRVSNESVNGLVDAIRKVFSEREEEFQEKLVKNFNLIVENYDQRKCFSVIKNIYNNLS